MLLVLMRHGLAEDAGPSGDAARALSSGGRRKAQAVCRALAGMELGLQQVFSSSLLRSVQTATLLQEALESRGEKPPALCHDAFGLDGTPPEMSAVLDTGAWQRVAVVGHEPSLSAWAAWSMGGGRLRLRKAGVIILEGEDPSHAGWATLQALLPPGFLRRSG